MDHKYIIVLNLLPYSKKTNIFVSQFLNANIVLKYCSLYSNHEMELAVLGKTNITRKEDQDYANTVIASNLLTTLFFTVMHTGLRERHCTIT